LHFLHLSGTQPLAVAVALLWVLGPVAGWHSSITNTLTMQSAFVLLAEAKLAFAVVLQSVGAPLHLRAAASESVDVVTKFQCVVVPAGCVSGDVPCNHLAPQDKSSVQPDTHSTPQQFSLTSKVGSCCFPTLPDVEHLAGQAQTFQRAPRQLHSLRSQYVRSMGRRSFDPHRHDCKFLKQILVFCCQ